MEGEKSNLRAKNQISRKDSKESNEKNLNLTAVQLLCYKFNKYISFQIYRLSQLFSHKYEVKEFFIF
jgi:hypothetical protein